MAHSRTPPLKTIGPIREPGLSLREVEPYVRLDQGEKRARALLELGSLGELQWPVAVLSLKLGWSRSGREAGAARNLPLLHLPCGR